MPSPVARHFDLAYRADAAADPLRHCLDLYQPAEPIGRGTLLFLHGGAWLGGDRTEVSHVGAAVAAGGFACALAGYRLAPAHRFPAQAEDAAAAARWLLAEGHGPLVLGGHSAGAHLAALLALDPQWLGESPPLAGVAGLCGVYDLERAARSSWMRQTMLIPALGDDPAAWRAASPVNHVRSVPFPFWLHNAEVDWGLPAQTRALAAGLRAAGVEVTTSVAPGTHHLNLAARLGQAGDESTERLLAFLRRCLNIA
jgi:acetyl esterase/lipase